MTGQCVEIKQIKIKIKIKNNNFQLINMTATTTSHHMMDDKTKLSVLSLTINGLFEDKKKK